MTESKMFLSHDILATGTCHCD